MATDDLGPFSLEDNLLHGRYFTVHDVVIYNDIFFSCNFCILNEAGPYRFGRGNFTFITTHYPLGNNDIPTGLNIAATYGTVDFNITIGLDVESVFYITTAHNSSHVGDISSLDIYTLNFVDFFNSDLIPDKGNMAVLLCDDGSSVLIKLCILSDRNRNILSVFSFKIAPHDGFSTFTTGRKNLDGKRLTCNDILDEIEFLEVYLTVGGFLKLKFCSVSFKFIFDVAISSMLRKYSRSNFIWNIIDRRINK